MGIKENSRALFRQAPADAIAALQLPALRQSNRLSGEFGYLHLFATTQKELEKYFPAMKKRLAANGMLWVSWPKGGQLNTDLSLPVIISICYRHGLVESTSLSVNATWSALKFTHPKKGKVYNNSYGKLPAGTHAS